MAVEVVEAPSVAQRNTAAGTHAGVDARAVEAFLTCMARTGWTKTTFDDIARETGCSRATLYRYFANKADIAAAALAAERDRFCRALIDAADDARSLEEALVAVVTGATRMLTGHEALGFLLAFEPEVILPHLTFSAGDHVLVEAGRVVAPAIAPFLSDDVDPLRAGEWVARSVFVYLARPDTPFDLTTEDGASALVRSFLAPALAGQPVHPEGE